MWPSPHRRARLALALAVLALVALALAVLALVALVLAL